jgi:hypothetical protein
MRCRSTRRTSRATDASPKDPSGGHRPRASFWVLRRRPRTRRAVPQSRRERMGPAGTSSRQRYSTLARFPGSALTMARPKFSSVAQGRSAWGLVRRRPAPKTSTLPRPRRFEPERWPPAMAVLLPRSEGCVALLVRRPATSPARRTPRSPASLRSSPGGAWAARVVHLCPRRPPCPAGSGPGSAPFGWARASRPTAPPMSWPPRPVH